MDRKISEKDWKIAKALKSASLNIACEKILTKVSAVLEEKETESHNTYKKIWSLMWEEDKQVASMFDGFKRSNAFFKLAAWKRNGILSDNDIKMLSGEAQGIIELLCSVDS